MKRFTLLLIMLTIGAVSVAGCIVKKSPTDTTNASTNTLDVPEPIPDDKNLVRITAPKPNTLISSPVTITGEARGTWFFEATFPIEITDDNGKVIGNGFAQAQGDWMTEDFVPFSATVTFEDPVTDTGGIILKKDNPSGLADKEQSLRIPVVFRIDNQTKILIYLASNTLKPGNTDCTVVYPVARSIPKTPAVARAAIEQLIAGPTPDERIGGFVTSINNSAIIKKLTIEQGVAKIDFNEALGWWANTPCKEAMINAQITQTLKQFPNVKNVVVTVEGNEDIYEP